jgi:hypothetical protein
MLYVPLTALVLATLIEIGSEAEKKVKRALSGPTGRIKALFWDR